LKLCTAVEAVRHLRAYHPSLEAEEHLVPLLGTMAMGDCNAVVFGQAAHLGLLLQLGSPRLEEFICLKNRPSRKRFMAGLMIDDLVLMGARSRGEAAESSFCRRAIEQVRERCKEVGLPRHEAKLFLRIEKPLFGQT